MRQRTDVGELAVTRQGVGTGDDEVVEVEHPPPGTLGLVAGVGLGHLSALVPLRRRCRRASST